MLKTLSAAIVAASLIAGPALAQSATPATQETHMTAPAAKAKLATHGVRKHVAHRHVVKKHLAKKHAAKKHFAKKQIKHVKTAKHVKPAGKPNAAL